MQDKNWILSYCRFLVSVVICVLLMMAVGFVVWEYRGVTM